MMWPSSATLEVYDVFRVSRLIDIVGPFWIFGARGLPVVPGEAAVKAEEEMFAEVKRANETRMLRLPSQAVIDGDAPTGPACKGIARVSFKMGPLPSMGLG
jgi:hypothetical protein